MDDPSEPSPTPSPDRLARWYTKGHYGRVVALLRAVNAKASIIFNGAIFGIHVVLEDGRTVVWSNYDNWAYTLVERDGTTRIYNSGVKADAPTDAVAKVILYSDYSPPSEDG